MLLLFTIVQSNGIVLAIITAPIILVLLAALYMTRSKALRNSRELDEYLRAARNKSGLDALNRPKITEDADVAPQEAADFQNPSAQSELSLSTKPVFSVIQGGKSKQKDQVSPAPSELPKPASNDDTVYFQPVMEMKSGHLSFYEVFRKYKPTGGKSHRFIQFLDKGTDRERAEFEYALAMNTLRFFRQLMDFEATSLDGKQDTRVILPISTSLLSQGDLWEKFIDFFEAHLGLTKNILIMVHLQSDKQTAIGVLNGARSGLKRLDLLEIKLGLTCPPALLDTVDRAVLRMCCLIGTPVELLNSEQALPKSARYDWQCTHINSEADIVAGLAAGANYMSGDHIAKPRALRLDAAQNKKQMISTSF
ncbi:MAG: hypothetical protein U5K75_06110 [Ahrensia sp.]|nr:hypothetical protein [Ahrensia sp.]